MQWKSPTIFCTALLLAGLSMSIESYSKPVEPTTSSTPASKASTTSLTGFATYYTVQSCKLERWGNRVPLMANGKPLCDDKITCAMPVKTMKAMNMRLGDCVQIISGTNAVTATVTDRGPNKKCQADGVVIDCSRALMLALAGVEGIKAGRIKVSVEPATR